jgi:hypothetical protein
MLIAPPRGGGAISDQRYGAGANFASRRVVGFAIADPLVRGAGTRLSWAP